MKFNLKLIAVAAAMVAASSAHADLANNSSGNSSLALVAFNQTTGSYYVRDLGYTLNTFLPNSVTTTATDGGGSAVSGNKTPGSGLNITWAAGTFSSWLTDQTSGTIAWTVAAGDGLTAAGTSNLSRALVAATGGAPSNITNNVVRNAVSTSAGVSGLATQNNDGTSWYDKTGATVIGTFTANNGFNGLNSLNTAANLYYYVTTAGTGASTTAANGSTFANSLYTATLTLASSGVLTYDLQPAVSAVPLPAAAWLMGAGLVGLGGMVRRRKAAAAV
ncbi:MAG: VPLPA-CTERM sorting domain-containing protein [Burkholderiales bacterium]